MDDDDALALVLTLFGLDAAAFPVADDMSGFVTSSVPQRSLSLQQWLVVCSVCRVRQGKTDVITCTMIPERLVLRRLCLVPC